VWILLRYFTITTNVLVAYVFACIAWRGPKRVKPCLMGATVLSIVLVGVVYAVLLSGETQLSGGSLIADILLHRITPILVPLFWLGLVQKGQLKPRDPLIWALYPLGYFLYALIRGSFEHHYAYPFMDPALLGWSRVMLNSVVMAAGFFAVGWLLVWLDRLLAMRRSRRQDTSSR
jgi:hypothetical protein